MRKPQNLLIALTFTLFSLASNSWGIDQQYRAILERSGCNQQNADKIDSPGKLSCDTSKPKSWNEKNTLNSEATTSLKDMKEAKKRETEKFVQERVRLAP